KGRVEVEVAVLEPVFEVAVEVGADAPALPELVRACGADGAEDVRRNPQGEIVGRREKEVQIGAAEVEGVEVVVAGARVDLGEELRPESGLPVVGPVAVD